MQKQKSKQSRIKIGKLETSFMKLSKTQQKKVKGGALAGGSVPSIKDGTSNIKDGTSNIKDGTSNT